MTHPIITINREYGSGGRSVGESVARELGIPCYNRVLIDKTAEESGLASAYIKVSEEKLPNDVLYGSASFGGVFSPFTPYVPYSNIDKMYFTQSDIIRQVAEAGPCVIIGRCANFILKDRPNVFSVFVHAYIRSRVKRIMKRFSIDAETAYNEMVKVDKHRANYYNYYTDTKWDDFKNYHAMLNTGFLEIDGCVKIIADIYRGLMLGRSNDA